MGSGSGKTTVLNLIERLYDPRAEAVLLDSRDLRSIDVGDLRRHMALVEQDAALIGSSIRDCLLSDHESVSDGAIEEACKAAGIFDFVVRLCSFLKFSWCR